MAIVGATPRVEAGTSARLTGASLPVTLRTTPLTGTAASARANASIVG